MYIKDMEYLLQQVVYLTMDNQTPHELMVEFDEEWKIMINVGKTESTTIVIIYNDLLSLNLPTIGAIFGDIPILRGDIELPKNICQQMTIWAGKKITKLIGCANEIQEKLETIYNNQ